MIQKVRVVHNSCPVELAHDWPDFTPTLGRHQHEPRVQEKAMPDRPPRRLPDLRLRPRHG